MLFLRWAVVANEITKPRPAILWFLHSPIERAEPIFIRTCDSSPVAGYKTQKHHHWDNAHVCQTFHQSRKISEISQIFQLAKKKVFSDATFTIIVLKCNIRHPRHSPPPSVKCDIRDMPHEHSDRSQCYQQTGQSSTNVSHFPPTN